jgi:alpha-1,2-glucosyltransferase
MVRGRRYFLIPFSILLLHSEPLPKGQLLLTAAMYAGVNALSLYLFLFRPFTWPDGSVARFMW